MGSPIGDRLLRAAAFIVPADRRADWLAEWRAELDYATNRARQDGTLTATRRSAIRLRAAGAMLHALWLRRDRWRIEPVWQDLQYAVKSLIRNPGFALVTVLTLGIGIGANAAIFSAVRAVLLRPLPFPESEALVSVSTTTVARPLLVGGSSAPPDFVDWRRNLASFAEMAAINANASALTGDGGPAEQVPDAQVTGGFFAVLTVAPLHGRTLTPDDDAMGAPNVVVISHELWMRRFGGRAGVVGESITLDGASARVVGVMPRGFAYPIGAELWLPLKFSEADLTTQRGALYLDVIARLRPGVAMESAQGEMRAYAKRLAESYPRTNADRTASLFVLRAALVGDVKPAMLLLLGAVAFVLLIVCVNVANLVLTRALGRQRELAVRAALGAGRARLIRGLLVESAVLGAAGGAAGLLIAVWATRAIASLDAGLGIPFLDQTRVDAAALWFTMGVSLLVAVLVGILPAWHASSRLDVARRIREDSRTVTGDANRQRLRSGLIVAETALAVVLLVGAGLLMRSFVRLAAVDLGFKTDRVQAFNVSLPTPGYPTPASRAAFMETLMAQLGARPQVEAAGAVFGLPLTDFGYVISMSTLDGRQITDSDEQNKRSLQVRIVTPEYFHAMGIPLRRGRAIEAGDRLGAPAAILVNETAAERLWPGADPLGHNFTLGTRMGQGGERAGGTVVGVVGDARDFGPARPVRPTVFLSHSQFPMSFFSVTVKSRPDAPAVVEMARGIVAAIDANLPIFQVRTMDQLASNVVAQPRLYLMLIGLFAAAAVLLAAIGIYGVLAHNVSQRTREIGIRLALGAPRGQVVRRVVVQASALACAGLVLGLVLAAATGRYIQGLLFGVQPIDSLTYLAVAAGLLLTALVASWLPARRAARVDPIVALRAD